jgi:hypothetical protein
VAGCGGSKSASTSSTPTAPPTAPATTQPATTTTRPTPPRTTATSTTETTASTPTGAINVRVPARFTILPGGSVSPPTVTIPAHLPVELVVVSNGATHRIALGSTKLTVRAHARAEALIDGLRTGSYPLNVDGAPKAVLTIGGEPGP